MVVELDGCYEMAPLIQYEVMNYLHVVVEKGLIKKASWQNAQGIHLFEITY